MTLEEEQQQHNAEDYRSLIKWVVGIVSAVTVIVTATAVIGGFMAYNRLTVMEQQMKSLNTTITEMRIRLDANNNDRFTGTQGTAHQVRIEAIERELARREVRLGSLEKDVKDLEKDLDDLTRGK